MRLPEQRLWDWLDRRCGHSAHLQRIENRVGSGVPDVFAATFGWQGWVELKVLPAWPKKPSTPVRLQHWTPVQRNWARRHEDYCGRVALLVEIAQSETLVLFRALDAVAAIDTWTRDEWLHRAIWSGQRNAKCEQVLDGLRRV
jgi:hypothetical protein